MELELREKEIHFPFLAGGGEMGELIRNYPWTSSPVGTPQLWPASLRTMVSTLLHSRHPMLLWWGEDLIQFYNDAYRPSLGLNGKHPMALGQKGKDCWPEIWTTIHPLIEQVLAGGSTWSEDQLIPIFRNGKIEDVYWTFGYSPVLNDAGRIEGVMVVCNETTEKVMNMKMLSEQRQELNFAIDASELGTWDLNPFTQRFVGNERLKRWFGLQPSDEIKLNQAIDVILDKDKLRVINGINYALTFESGGDYDIEYTIVNQLTGTERVVRAKGKTLFNDSKAPIRFSGILQDITDRRNAEDRIQQTATRLELALDAGNLGSYEYIVDTGEIFCTARCKMNFGLQSEDAFSFDKLIGCILPEDRDAMQKAIERAFAGHRIYHTEYRIHWPDGTVRWISASGKGVYDDNDRPIKMIGITADITEEKESAQGLERLVQERTTELENKNRELERSNVSLEEFTHIASHDLKEPIRKIHFFVDRLKSQLSDRLTKDEAVTFSRIENANDRMVNLIDDLLMYSRFSQRPLEMEQTGLNEKVNKVLEDLEVDIHQKKAIVTVAALPVIKGYPVQLQQLFQNLIGNALKYQQQGVPPVVVISVSRIEDHDGELAMPSHGSYHRIEVRDNGIGFEQDQAERIFQMFQRLHGNAEYRGTGVGLAIARKVVENHRGIIVAHSAPGKGSTFSIYFPV